MSHMLLCKTRVHNTMHITNAWDDLTLESQKPPICSLTANFYLWCNAERHPSIGNRCQYNNLGSRNHRFLCLHWKQTNITWMSKLLHSRMSRWRMSSVHTKSKDFSVFYVQSCCHTTANLHQFLSAVRPLNPCARFLHLLSTHLDVNRWPDTRTRWGNYWRHWPTQICDIRCSLNIIALSLQKHVDCCDLQPHEQTSLSSHGHHQ
jgi:hypothetical protein